jgi:peptidoglycan/xylan/chitin deacetylase (PgdA/CDA1 family)
MLFLLLSLLVGLAVWFGWYRQSVLRVLMYHKVSESKCDMLTVDTKQLNEQLHFLRKKGYQFLTIADLSADKIPKKAVLLTFDDAYLNNLEIAYPVLKKWGARAIIFVPTAYVGSSSSWDYESEPLLSVEQLKKLDNSVFELGLHSHQHQNFREMSADDIEADLRENQLFFQKNRLVFANVLAYPYGGRPKSSSEKAALRQLLVKLNVRFAFRIGNRLNRWPLAQPFEIQRIDIRGTDSFKDFKRKVRWGKWL